MHSTKNFFLKGFAQPKAALSADYGKKNLFADDFTCPFQEAMAARCLGSDWGGDVIDAKTLSTMNPQMIGAFGKMHQREIHCCGAINNGVSQDEIRAIIHVIGIFFGAPRALECFRVRNVLEEA